MKKQTIPLSSEWTIWSEGEKEIHKKQHVIQHHTCVFCNKKDLTKVYKWCTNNIPPTHVQNKFTCTNVKDVGIYYIIQSCEKCVIDFGLKVEKSPHECECAVVIIKQNI